MNGVGISGVSWQISNPPSSYKVESNCIAKSIKHKSKAATAKSSWDKMRFGALVF